MIHHYKRLSPYLYSKERSVRLKQDASVYTGVVRNSYQGYAMSGWYKLDCPFSSVTHLKAAGGHDHMPWKGINFKNPLTKKVHFFRSQCQNKEKNSKML